MNILTIPFTQHTGITVASPTTLSLKPDAHTLNHLQSIHAGALYTLAETQSGLYLQTLFPDLEDKVIPLLRESQIKYKHPATTTVTAHAHASDEAIEKFTQQLEKKGRGVIGVDVEVKDAEGNVTCQGSFTWFVQKVPTQ